jgi:hypothetical protein
MSAADRIIGHVAGAVFAAVVRPPPHRYRRGRVHQQPLWSRARALAWRMATMPAAMT